MYSSKQPATVPTTAAELATLKATEGNPTVPKSWTANATALWQDALAQAAKEKAKWPYAWVSDEGYTKAADRATVTGRIVLDDKLAPKGSSTKLPNLIVGLFDSRAGVPTAPPAAGRPAQPVNADSWMRDAKYYQFFERGSADGKFTLGKVRPGNYTLVANADARSVTTAKPCIEENIEHHALAGSALPPLLKLHSVIVSPDREAF